MLTQYLILLEATKSGNQSKLSRVLILQRLRKGPFMSFHFSKFYDKASGSALFLIFDQISGSCPYNNVLTKPKCCKQCNKDPLYKTPFVKLNLTDGMDDKLQLDKVF